MVLLKLKGSRFNMGRDCYSPRRVLEHSAGIRIQDLNNYGLLNRGSLKAHWNYEIIRNGYEKLTDVTFTVQLSNMERLNEDNFIHFDYEYQGKEISFRHGIEIQPVNFGGHRYFFICNATKNGKYCGRRVKALYFGGTVWACRHCLELVYMNCRYNRDIFRLKYNAEILQKKADTLRMYGHPRKANRLEWRAREYELRHDEAFIQSMRRFLSRHS